MRYSVWFLLVFVRDSVMEILFEQDNEEKSVASLILDALVKVEKSYSSLCVCKVLCS